MNTIKTKDKYEFFMRAVYSAANLSKDPRTKIGGILVKNDNIVSSGFNNFPRKVLDLEERYNDREFKYSLICHGEFNCLLNAARHGISTLDSILFTQGRPCSECCKAIIQAGCKTVVVHKQWPNLLYSEKWIKSDKISQIMLNEAGVEIEWYDKILNIEGFLDGKIIKV